MMLSSAAISLAILASTGYVFSAPIVPSAFAPAIIANPSLQALADKLREQQIITRDNAEVDSEALSFSKLKGIGKIGEDIGSIFGSLFPSSPPPPQAAPPSMVSQRGRLDLIARAIADDNESGASLISSTFRRLLGSVKGNPNLASDFAGLFESQHNKRDNQRDTGALAGTPASHSCCGAMTLPIISNGIIHGSDLLEFLARVDDKFGDKSGASIVSGITSIFNDLVGKLKKIKTTTNIASDVTSAFDSSQQQAPAPRSPAVQQRDVESGRFTPISAPTSSPSSRFSFNRFRVSAASANTRELLELSARDYSGSTAPAQTRDFVEFLARAFDADESGASIPGSLLGFVPDFGKIFGNLKERQPARSMEELD